MSYLGKYLRLSGISIDELPAHAALDATNNASRPDLRTFVHDVLEEGIPLVEDVSSREGSRSSAWKECGKPRVYPQSLSPVEVLTRNFKLEDAEDEEWYSRVSRHEPEAIPGSATWEEFAATMGENRRQAEAYFNPSITASRTAFQWDVDGMFVYFDQWGRYEILRVEAVEDSFRIQKPFHDRTFPFVNVCAKSVTGNEYIVASVALTDFQRCAAAEYVIVKDIVIGKYPLVERWRGLENGSTEWILVTATDAGGAIPQVLTNLGDPDQMAHDVPMFMTWIQKYRAMSSAEKGAIF